MLQLGVSFSKVRRAGLQLPFFKTFGRCAMLQLAVLKTFGGRDVLRDAQAEGVNLYGSTFYAYFTRYELSISYRSLLPLSP